MSDEFKVYGEIVKSRLLLGTALYPSPQEMQSSIDASGCSVITLSLRRQNPQEQSGREIWKLIRDSGCRLLPNTAGCHSVKEAVNLSEMSREIFHTHWIKLEVVGDDYNLQPDPFGLVKAAEILIKRGFAVLPYCTEDLVLARRLMDAGCEVLMPWGAPIGTGQGLLNLYHLEALRDRLPETTLIIDAGIGAPSQASKAMELGFDAVLLNTAVAKASSPAAMAKAFKLAVEAGRLGFKAGLMQKRQTASPSTPTLGMPFWHQGL